MSKNKTVNKQEKQKEQKKQPEEYKIVRINWVDSCDYNSDSCWHNKESVLKNWECKPQIIESVAFLIRETEDVIVTAKSISDSCFGEVLTIPKCAITKIKRIK